MKPAVEKINAFTRFHVISFKVGAHKFTIIYKRLKKMKQGSLNVIVNRHPHIPMAAKDYSSTLFYERKFTPKASVAKKPKNLPYVSLEAYVAKLAEEGFGEKMARSYAKKRYGTILPGVEIGNLLQVFKAGGSIESPPFF